MMNLTRAQWLTLLSALLTFAIGLATNIATDQMPTGAQTYLWLAWPLLGLLIILFLFVTLRQAPAELGPPSRELEQAYLQEVAAEPVRTPADEVLGEAEFIPREVTAQKTGLFLRFATVYRPGMPTEAAAGGLTHPEPLDAVLARERRLVLLGEPGMGKTTSLRHLAQATAQQALAGHGDIPIYFELKYYNGEMELETRLVLCVNKILRPRNLALSTDPDKSTRILKAWMAQSNTRFLILLDGLNEVRPEFYTTVRGALKTLLDSPHHIIISCRERDYDESLRKYAAAFVLQGLQQGEIRGYLHERLGDGDKALFDQIRWDEKMWTLVANPLMLWLVGKIVQPNKAAPLPANRGRLLQQFVAQMPGLRTGEEFRMEVSPGVVTTALAKLGFEMQERGRLAVDLCEVLGWLIPTAGRQLEDILIAGKGLALSQIGRTVG